MYTDESQNQPCTHSPRLRTASDTAASRALLQGLTSACVFVDNLVYTRIYLHIPPVRERGCTCDVTVQPFTKAPTFKERNWPVGAGGLCSVAVQPSFLSFNSKTAASRAHVVTACVNCCLLCRLCNLCFCSSVTRMIVGLSAHLRIKVLILRHVVYMGEVPLSDTKLSLIGRRLTPLLIVASINHLLHN